MFDGLADEDAGLLPRPLFAEQRHECRLPSMTTNAGASDMARESIGFGAASREDAQEDAVKKMFTPEFRNRLDAIVPFSYLPPAVVARVVDKFILQLELQLADRNVHIELDEEARACRR